MIKDIFFVLVVLSVAIYAHSNKDEIVSFIDLSEEKNIFEGLFVVKDD